LYPMSIRQIFLRPIARLGALHAQRQLRSFLASHRRTRSVQDKFLAEFLRAHSQTAFGQDHNLGQVRSYEDFRLAVPITDYQYIQPYMSRVLHGEPGALLPADQPVLMFSMTSGTTGEPKHIPVTPRFLADIRRGWNLFGVNVFGQHPRAWLRPLVQISSFSSERLSPSGQPCGAISGLLASTQKRVVRWMYAVPQWVASLADPTTRYYAILRHSIARDVAFITTANPSSTIKLIETGQAQVERLIRDVRDGTFTPPESDATNQTGLPKNISANFKPNPALAARLEAGLARDGQLLPKHFWNVEFLTNWTGGTLSLYLRRLRELFPGAAIHDIGLLASEGRFSVPLEPNTPSGVAEITSNFLEFIPVDERQQSQPKTLRADELDVGGEYFLVVTNWAGLYRYNLDDRVRVTGFIGQTPTFEFLSRGTCTANITGEKITEHQVVAAMAQARRQTGCDIERFVLQGRFCRSGEPCYELRIERADGLDPQVLAQRMDDALARLNIEYASKRKDGRLGPIRPCPMQPGSFAQAERQTILERPGRGEQYKHQYLLTDIIDEGGSEGSQQVE